MWLIFLEFFLKLSGCFMTKCMWKYIISAHHSNTQYYTILHCITQCFNFLHRMSDYFTPGLRDAGVTHKLFFSITGIILNFNIFILKSNYKSMPFQTKIFFWAQTKIYVWPTRCSWACLWSTVGREENLIFWHNSLL